MRFLKIVLLLFSLLSANIFSIQAQNIFSGEPIQVVGQMNSYSTASGSNSTYRRVSVNTGNPADGRGHWVKTYNVQNSGGDFTPRSMSGGGGSGFLFISGPSSNRFQNKWVFSGTSVAALNTINNISAYNFGNDMGLNMSSAGRYTFVFNDCGYTATNAKFYVGYTQNAPVTITRSSITVNADRSATVSITSSDSCSPGENIYIRYTTGSNFASTGTSSIVQATPLNSPTNTNWTATIPVTGTVNSTIRYYVFTSTLNLTTLNSLIELEKSLAVLRVDDSLGLNYMYTFPSTFTSVQSGNFSDATTWGTAYVPGGNYTIANGHTVVLDANSSVNSLSINSGGTLVGDNGSAKTLTIANGGSFSNAGTYTSSTFSNISFAGTGTISGTSTFGNISISGGVDFGAGSSINGSLTLQPGSFVANNAPTYNSGSLLIYNTGGTYGRSLEWSSTSGAGYPHHVQVSGNTTLNVKGTSNTARFMGGNLSIDAGSTLSLQDLSIVSPTVIGLTVGGNIINNGTLNMGTSTERILAASYTNSTGATTTLSSVSGGDLEITGNLIDNGTFNSNSRAVFFSGSGIQEVSGSGTFNIDYIVSSKSGGSIRMMSDLLCEGPNGGNAITLNSVTDELDLNGFNLTLGKSGVSSGISGSGSLIGDASSNLTILGNGSFGTIRFSSGSEIVNHLNINRASSGSVNLGSNLTVLGNLVLNQGNLQVGSNQKLTYSGSSISRTSGTLQIGNSGNELVFENSSDISLPSSMFNGNIQTLRINGTGKVTIGSAIGINSYLVMNGGNLVGSSVNTITMLNSSDTAINRQGGYIEGSLIRRIPASSAGTLSYIYPIGKTSYAPLELVNPITTSGGVVDVKAEVFETSTGGTAGANMMSISSNRYWESSITSGSSNFTSTNIRLTEASIGSMNSLAISSTLTGSYAKVSSAAPSASSILSDSITSLGFFVFGEAIPSFTSVQSGNFSDATTWGTAYVPGGNYTIANGHTVVLDANSSVNSLSINSGGTLVGDNGSAKTLTIANGGSFSNAGTYTSSTFSNISFAGTGTISGTSTFGNISISGGVDFGAGSSINGSLTLQPGSFVANNAPTYNSGSLLIYNTGGTYGRSLEWSSTSGAGYPHHVQVSGNTTLNVKGTSNTARFMGGNLSIDAGSTLSLQDLSIVSPTVIGLTVGGNIINNGTLNMGTSTERILAASYTNSTGATTTLSSVSGGDLEITGNLIDNGTFNSNSRAVFFSGSGIQEVSGSGTFNIDYIVSSKSGGSIRMMSDLLCEGPNGGNAITLNSVTDELDLNGFNLTLGKSGVSSGISGSGSLIGDASSNLTILGNGSFGTIRFSSGSEIVNHLNINRASSGSVNLGSNLTVLGNLVLNQGNLQVGSNQKLTYSGSSISRTSGTLQIGNSGNELVFENSSDISLPSSMFNGNIQTLRINGTGKVTIGSAIGINSYLVMNGGNLVGSSVNTITMLNSSDTAINRQGGYIEGSLIRRIPASSAGTLSYIYPIGKTSYAPLELVNPITTSGGVVDVKAEVFETSTGGTAGANMMSISSNRYWESSITSGSSNFTSTNIRLTEASIGSMNSLAISSTLTGSYAKVSSAAPSASSILSDSLSTLGFFVFGTDSSSLSSSSASLSITVFLEGLYTGSSAMTTAPYNADGITPNTIADTIFIVLHDKNNFDSVYSVKTTLGVGGDAIASIPASFIGNAYYVAIKHRNSIETWSADTIVLNSSTSYNFSTSASQAYGANQVDLGSGVFGIYSGDINQDGSIDFLDYPDLDLGSINGDLGYLNTDLNGDASVDFLDYPIIDLNSINGVVMLRP
ncbi:MAG: hypothetical protein ACOVP1_02420 [Bacteroidia bacterium]